MFERRKRTITPLRFLGRWVSHCASQDCFAPRGVVCAIFLISAIFVSPAALAGTVFGTVKKQSGEILAAQVVEFQKQGATNTIKVRTDEMGRYRIVLPKGNYTVKYDGLTATIKSYRDSVRQDIVFQ